MMCIQSECMNRTTGCGGYGECQAERMKREASNTVSFTLGGIAAVSGQVTNPFGFSPMVQQGWECPRCKTIHAPFMPTCMNCKSPKVDYMQGAGAPVKNGGGS